jgi:hypothetical protein
VPDADPIFDGEAPGPAEGADHVDVTAPVPMPAAPLGGPTRDSLAPEGYDEVDDDGGDDAWSLTGRE